MWAPPESLLVPRAPGRRRPSWAPPGPRSRSRRRGRDRPCSRRFRRTAAEPVRPRHGPGPRPRRRPRRPVPRAGRSAGRTQTPTRTRWWERSHVLEGRQVSVKAQSRDHTFGRRGRHHPVSLRLAAEDIGDMDLDHQLAGAAQRISERETVMRECAWIDDDRVTRLGFDPVDQLTLVIRLPKAELDAELPGTVGEHVLEI